ncbi:MAG: 2-oxo acid dehydrogenase subunit E2 [Spirochaetes bacterium]|nr:2-oxo acid dehydrogenase subunit E2 [Spirochaetota bacterium]
MKEEYTIHNYPKSRIGTFDVGAMSSMRHHVFGIMEVDVTDARKKIAKLKKGGRPVSFTSWLLKCIGDVVNKHPVIHGVKKGKRKIIAFNSVDISIMIEKMVGSVPVPIPYIVREANGKSIADIYKEIRAARDQRIEDEGDYVLGESRGRLLMYLYYLLPGFMRRLSWKIILSNPKLVKNLMGSVIVTSVGMVANVRGWIIPRSIHPLCFAIGSINPRPGVVNGEICVREYLPITVLIDHDVIDGSPAVRVINELVRALEGGYLL